MFRWGFNKLMTDADVLNRIEQRIRENKPVKEREARLLLECYAVYDVPIPKDIRTKLKDFF